MVLQTWGKWSGSFFFRPHVTTLLYLARMVVSCPWHVRFWRIHCKFQHRAGQNCLAAGFFFTCWVLMKFSNLGRYSEAQEWHRNGTGCEKRAGSEAIDSNQWKYWRNSFHICTRIPKAFTYTMFFGKAPHLHLSCMFDWQMYQIWWLQSWRLNPSPSLDLYIYGIVFYSSVLHNIGIRGW